MAVNAGFVQLSGANTSWGAASGYTSAQVLPANPNRKRALLNNFLQWTVFGTSGLHLSGTLYASGNYFQPQENLPFEITDTDSIWAIGYSGDIVSFLEENVTMQAPGAPVVHTSGIVLNSGVATKVLSANSGRTQVTLQLQGAGPVYVGSTSGITSGYGVPFGNGTSVPLDWQTDIWAINPFAGSGVMMYEEESLV